MNKQRYKKITIIDNFDSFTFNLVDYLEQLNCQVQVYRNTVNPNLIASLDSDLLMISPGPSVPKNAGNLMEIIDLYHKSLPIFGVCLGLEALVEYFGGSLKLTQPVHGEADEINHDGRTIFSGLDHSFLAGRYHSLVANFVPNSFEISATCKPSLKNEADLVMAIRHKTLPIEAVQFHPESVLTMKNAQGFKLLKNLIYQHEL